MNSLPAPRDMKKPSDRMPPLPEGSYTPAQAKVAAELVAGPRGAVFGPFVPLLRSPDLLSPLQKAGEYLRYKSALEPRLSEFAILVVAKRWSQAVEWSIHAPIALQCGVSPRRTSMRSRKAAVPRRCPTTSRSCTTSSKSSSPTAA
jgi:hypothetical protein